MSNVSPAAAFVAALVFGLAAGIAPAFANNFDGAGSAQGGCYGPAYGNVSQNQGDNCLPNVADVQCVIQAALLAPVKPVCLNQPAELAGSDGDINCDGNVDVVDVEISINRALGAPLNALIDANDDGAADACVAPCNEGDDPYEVCPDDGNACTVPLCVGFGSAHICITHTPAPGGASCTLCNNASDCDDGDPCTTNGCLPTGPTEQGLCYSVYNTCDDGDPCTKDFCDATTGECSHEYDNSCDCHFVVCSGSECNDGYLQISDGWKLQENPPGDPLYGEELYECDAGTLVPIFGNQDATNTCTFNMLGFVGDIFPLPLVPGGYVEDLASGEILIQCPAE